MSWLNLNESLNNLKGHITNFANNVLEIEQGDSTPDSNLEALQSNRVFQNTEGESSWNWDAGEAKTDETKTNETISHLRKVISLLEKEKEDFCNKIELLDKEYQENTIKLASLKEKLETRYNDLKVKYEHSQEENNLLKEIEQRYFKEVKQSETLSSLVKKLQNELELKKQNEAVKEAKESETKPVFKKDIQTELNDHDHDHDAECNHKLLNDSLQKEVNELKAVNLEIKSKYNILDEEFRKHKHEYAEKLSRNEEIIKLLTEKSNNLEEDSLNKSEMIENLEEKIFDLTTKNELLVEEMNQLGSNSNLQTISESNEDNLLLLESQLETANKTIENLQFELTKDKDSCLFDTVNKTEGENDKKIEDLTEQYSQLEIENSEIKSKIFTLQKDYEQCLNEKLENEEMYYKLKSDFENTEYQLTEMNINNESIKEENEAYKHQISLLNEKMKEIQLELKAEKINSSTLKSENNKLHTELYNREDENRLLENQIDEIKERFQNSRITETTLKLQNDTLKSELLQISELKQQLEKELQSLFAVLNDIYKLISGQLQNNLSLGISFPINISDLNQELNFNITDVSSNVDKIKTILEEYIKQNIFMSNFMKEYKSNLQTLNEKNSAYEKLFKRILMVSDESKAEFSDISLNDASTEKLETLVKKLEINLSGNSNLEKLLSENEYLLSQNNILKESYNKMSNNLLEEQSNVQRLLSERAALMEKEASLIKNVERLQNHLIEMEEHYTQELIQAENKKAELQQKVIEMEHRERNSSNLYTSVNIRANQQVETLQNQMQLITAHRDDLQKKLADAEKHNKENIDALANLHNVLEQFQKDKEVEINKEKERVYKLVEFEKNMQEELKQEIKTLKRQLEESKQGLNAASRLADQLAASQQQTSLLKKEVTHLKKKLEENEEKLKTIFKSSEDKVDKSLVKNLVIGCLSCGNSITKDQAQIIKILSHVLDFNQDDHKRLDLKESQSSWFNLLPASQSSQGSSESLTQAFVKFLQTESNPVNIPDFINYSKVEDDSNRGQKGQETNNQASSSSRILSDIFLPTFSDFAENRNSSSILKDVLKDSNIPK